MGLLGQTVKQRGSVMNELVKRQRIFELDGFNDFTDEVEGEEERASGRVIQGVKIRFDDPHWYNNVGQHLTGKLLTTVGVINVVNKWDLQKNVPLETQILAPGEKFPNFTKRNAECPESEWGDKFGKWTGPWQGQHVVYFIDEHYNKYSWPSPVTTIGSAIAVRELADQIRMVRQVKGENVYPVTELGHIDFPTRVGLKQRPYLLNIKNWIRLGAEQIGDPLPAPDTPMTIETTHGTGTPAGAQSVEKPTAKEVTDDEIRF
jgi:hypothetical protein